jgi:general secretion pathway protein G
MSCVGGRFSENEGGLGVEEEGRRVAGDVSVHLFNGPVGDEALSTTKWNLKNSLDERGRGRYVMIGKRMLNLGRLQSEGCPVREDRPMGEGEALALPARLHGKRYFVKVRGGFTLIELLIVMVVVLLLAGLLLGAVLVVRGRVRVVQQVAEITQLDLALTKFKEKYGIFPPSRIRLREWDFRAATPAAGSTAYVQTDPFDQHSITYLRRIWPSIKLWVQNAGSNVETPDNGSIGQWFADNSGNGPAAPQVYELEGDECLVFFLGGICEKTGTDKYILHGFTDDPSNPSRVPSPVAWGAAVPAATSTRVQKRIPSTFPFDVGRLYQRVSFGTDLIAPRTAGTAQAEFAPSNNFPDFFGGPAGSAAGLNSPGLLPSYKVAGADQSRPLPIAYFSAYEGRGYRPDDLNIPPASTAVFQDHQQVFQLNWPQVTGSAITPGTSRISPLSLGPNPYSRNAATPDRRTGAAAGSRIQPYNPQTYQLILPGGDNEFGGGGSQIDYSATPITVPNASTSWLPNEDNLANFTSGTAVGEFANQQTQK